MAPVVEIRPAANPDMPFPAVWFLSSDTSVSFRITNQFDREAAFKAYFSVGNASVRVWRTNLLFAAWAGEWTT